VERLYKALIKYGKDGKYPFHMPGHKRKEIEKEFGQLYKNDITEIEGFDYLHDAKDILKHAMEHAAKVYRSENTYFLINGSTCGNLTALSSVLNKGDKVIVARNCHKSVYNALYLTEAIPLYIYPKKVLPYDIMMGISPDDVESIIKNNDDVKAMIITSPTYEGIVSDIKKISDILHKKNIPLIVDEAHGAHFGIDSFPKSAIEYADIVIQSVHKTLPAFTQTALLHVNSKLVDIERINRFLSIYQSSSPSYLLMAGIDRCMYFVDEEGEKFRNYYANLVNFHNKSMELKKLKILNKKEFPDIFDFDLGKIVVFSGFTNMSGKELYNLLIEKYNFHPEMAAGQYCILMTSVMDEESDYDKLFEALKEIDSKLEITEENQAVKIIDTQKLTFAMSIRDALDNEKEYVLRKDAENRISAEYIYLYPPGSPYIVPGEIIDKGILEEIEKLEKSALSVVNSNMNQKKELAVVKNG